MLLKTILFPLWGFYAHVTINTEAVFLLPKEMFPFFKENMSEIKKRAVMPDQRRNLSDEEAGRHYVDIELYDDEFLEKSINYNDALLIYGENHIHEHGYSPWNLMNYYYALRTAFEKKDEEMILKYAGEMGHYLSDLHVPLHTTHNYNGQLTGQYGIHSFWETTLPEKFGSYYNFPKQNPYFIENPLDTLWVIMGESHSLVKKVLNDESTVVQQLSSPAKMKISRRGRSLVTQGNDEYVKLYHEKLGGMVEKRMQLSILRLASIWYSCWIDAGQPDLNSLLKNKKHKKRKGKNRKQS